MDKVAAFVMLLMLILGAAFLLGVAGAQRTVHGNVYSFAGTENSIQNSSSNYTSAGA